LIDPQSEWLALAVERIDTFALGFCKGTAGVAQIARVFFAEGDLTTRPVRFRVRAPGLWFLLCCHVADFNEKKRLKKEGLPPTIEEIDEKDSGD
jgi:hypothetical protein